MQQLDPSDCQLRCWYQCMAGDQLSGDDTNKATRKAWLNLDIPVASRLIVGRRLNDWFCIAGLLIMRAIMCMHAPIWSGLAHMLLWLVCAGMVDLIAQKQDEGQKRAN